jgi:hypothetical protein
MFEGYGTRFHCFLSKNHPTARELSFSSGAGASQPRPRHRPPVANFVERRKAEVQLRRITLIRCSPVYNSRKLAVDLARGAPH